MRPAGIRTTSWGKILEKREESRAGASDLSEIRISQISREPPLSLERANFSSFE
jgi:hypothetical protein